MTDAIRAEFNTWWDRQPFNAQFEDVKAQMFNVWVASRAGCVVEMPEAYATDADGCWMVPRSEMRRAIEDVGVRVRP